MQEVREGVIQTPREGWSRKKEQQMQRSCGRNMLGLLEQQQGGEAGLRRQSGSATEGLVGRGEDSGFYSG